MGESVFQRVHLGSEPGGIEASMSKAFYAIPLPPDAALTFNDIFIHDNSVDPKVSWLLKEVLP